MKSIKNLLIRVGTLLIFGSISVSAMAQIITVQRTPSPMVAGQSYSVTWSSPSTVQGVSYNCTASGTGFVGSSGQMARNGTLTGIANAAWVGFPSTCTWTATVQLGLILNGPNYITETVTTVPPPTVPTISVTRTPSPMAPGQNYTVTWSTTDTTSLSYNCLSNGTGFTGNSGPLPANGSSSGTANPAWVGFPSTCTWTAVGPKGSTTYVEILVTTLTSSTVTYFHNDVIGSPVAATDQNGNVVWKESYRPYGEQLQKQAASSNNHLWFAKKSFEQSTGLSYSGARYYDPMLGRFMGVDPVGFKEGNIHSFNRYTYGNNNPYKFVDPDGREPNAIENWWNASVAGFKSESWTDFGVRVLQGIPAEAGMVGTFGMIKNAAKTEQALNKVSVVARDGNVVELLAKGKGGDITVITQMTKDGNKLVLEGTHIGGPGKGASSLSELRELARDLGRQNGVESVVVKGGQRTTGANPGKVPRDITIKVEQ